MYQNESMSILGFLLDFNIEICSSTFHPSVSKRNVNLEFLLKIRILESSECNPESLEFVVSLLLRLSDEKMTPIAGLIG